MDAAYDGSLFVMEANTTIITTINVMSFMTDLTVRFDEMKYWSVITSSLIMRE